MKRLIFLTICFVLFLVPAAHAAFPYSMTYTVSAGDTILAAHINTSNNEHINNNRPGSIDDYSNTDGEFQSTKDPYPGESLSRPVTLAEDLKTLRYQILEIQKALGISITNWTDDVNYILKKNPLINADFNVWQRGTSFATVSNADYGADRFLYAKVGAMVHTVSRSADVPTVAESNHLSKYSILVDCTTVDSSIAAGDLASIEQRIEGYNFLPLAQQAMTLSFWHKHTLAGTYCISVKNSGSDRSYVSEYTQATTDTWEKATVTITASPSAGTWDYTTGIGLFVVWTIAMGTDFQGTIDTWESANDLSTDQQVNACNSTDNNFRLAQVKLEQGSVATRFVGEEIGTDLNKCKRYYEELNSEANTSYWYATGMATDTTAAKFVIPYKAKRVVPTVTVSAAGDFQVARSNNTVENVTVFTLTNPSLRSVFGQITVAGNLAAGDATILFDDSNGTSRIYIDAEL